MFPHPAFHPFHKEGRKHADDAERDQRPANGRGEQDGGIAVADEQGTAQALFTDGAEDEPKHDGRRVQVELAREVADNPENHHDDHFDVVVVDGVGADHAQEEDRRDQDGVGKARDAGESLAAEQTDAEHEELDEHEAREERIGHARMGGEQFRAGLQAVDDEPAHEHGGHGFAGDAERQRGDERTAGDGVVGGFGTGHAFDGALAELVLMLGEAPGLVVAHETGDGRPRAGQDADDVPDEPRADDRRGNLLDLRLGDAELVLEVRGVGALDDLLFREDQHLRHGKEADEGAGRVDPVVERALAEHEARHAFHGVHADGGQEQAQNAGHEPLEDGPRGHPRDDGQPEEGKPKVFRALELHGELGEDRREEVERQAAQEAAAEGGEAGHRQRLGRLPAQGQLVAFDGRRRGSRGAGGMDEDGADGAAENGPAVDAAEHDEPRGGVHAEGDGQKQRHAHGGGKAGEAADGHAHHRGREHGEEIDGAKGVDEAHSHEGQSFHCQMPPLFEQKAHGQRNLEKEREHGVDHECHDAHREDEVAHGHAQEKQGSHKVRHAGDVEARDVHERHVADAAQREHRELSGQEAREDFRQIAADAPSFLAQQPDAPHEVQRIQNEKAADETHGIGLRVGLEIDGHDKEKQADRIDHRHDADIGFLHGHP